MSSGATHQRRTLLGIGLLSFLQLGFEVLFIKLGQYHFGTLAVLFIGIAMLGVALAAILTPRWGAPRRAMLIALAAFPPLALATGVLLFGLEFGFASLWLHLIACGSVALLALAVSSVPLWLELKQQPERAHAYYAASLAGSAVGPCAAIALLHFGDAVAFSVLLGLSSVVPLLLLHARSARVVACGAGLLAALAACLGLPALDRHAHRDDILIASDSFSRIDVTRTEKGGLLFKEGGICGRTETSRCLTQTLQPRILSIARLLRPKRVLVLGSGAGREVDEALEAGATEVTAVDINSLVSTALEQLLPPACNPYRDPKVRLVIGEGREAAAREALTHASGYDLVHVPFTGVTLGGGAGQPFAQSYLLTTEALKQYSPLLAPDGTIAISLWANFRRSVRPKIVRALAEALRGRSRDALAGHFLLLERKGLFVLLARPDRAFTAEERAQAAAASFEADLGDVDADLNQSHVRSLTDDRPFLNNDALRSPAEYTEQFDWSGPIMRGAFAVVVLLLLMVWFVCAVRAPAGLARAPAHGFYAAFTAMGIAYTVYETAVLQRFELLIGHPVTTTAAVLTAALLATAAGAFLSHSLSRARIANPLAIIGLLTWMICVAFLQPSWLLLASWPHAARIALAVLCTMPPFVVMGTFFPVELRAAAACDARLVSSCWIANGIGSIAGSLFVILTSMIAGVRSAIVAAALLYALLHTWQLLRRRGGAIGRAAHVAMAASILLALVATAAALWSNSSP